MLHYRKRDCKSRREWSVMSEFYLLIGAMDYEYWVMYDREAALKQKDEYETYTEEEATLWKCKKIEVVEDE